MRRTPGVFTGLEGKTILIEEPCNYVSNVAYYHSVTRICDYPDWVISPEQIKSQKRSFATLSIGSHFWHGSHTYAGEVFDNQMISVISYLALETITEHMPGNSTVLKQLSETPRGKSSYEVVEGLTKMFSDQPPSEWSKTLTDIDMPGDYFMNLTALVASVGALVCPWFVIDHVIGYLAPKVIKDKENANFFMNSFLPELGESTRQIVLRDGDAKKIKD